MLQQVFPILVFVATIFFLAMKRKKKKLANYK